MNAQDIRDHISQQCGFNSGVETPHTVDPNGNNETGDTLSATNLHGDKWNGETQDGVYVYIDQQGNLYESKERPVYRYSGQPLPYRAKPYAIQVCNAGAMPDHLPTSFEDWIKANGDSIPIDRTEATCKWFDELPKQLPF